MSIPSPEYIVNLTIQNSSNLEYKKLDEILFPIIKDNITNFSEEEVWDYIEKYKSDIANIFFKKENEAIEDGMKINFDLSEEDNEYYIKFFYTPEIKLLKEIQNDKPENFEIFCKTILEKMGGHSEVTGGPYDGGIDFVAYDLPLSNLNRISTIGSKIQVIGQAKRYTNGNNIKEKELREFIGASTKIIHEFKQSRSDRFGIFQPIILAFWTTSDFNSNAKSFAKKFGIWYLNGIALCQLAIELGVRSLSDSK